MLIKLLNYSIEKPGQFSCALHIHADNSGTLLFQQSLDFRCLTMLTVCMEMEESD